jgi:hypothetical protein
MAIDFNNLAKPYKTIVPIVNNKFQYHKKKYSFVAEDGWYEVTIQGNKVLEASRDCQVTTNLFYGYTYNNLLVFQNFDVAKRKWNFEVSGNLLFNTSDTFSSVVVSVWEDKNIFYVAPNYADYKIFDVKDCYDNDKNLSEIKGITPELRTVFLFHEIERSALRELLAKQEAEERHKELMETLAYRLKYSYERAGAVLLNYSLSGHKIITNWTYENSEYEYITEIDRRTMMVLNAGYCMNHDDRRHNITSLVLTAKDYENRNKIHITVRR